MDREAWRAAVNGVAKSRTWLSDWTELMGINLGISGSIISFNFHSTGATIASHHTHKETEAREAHVVVLGQGTNKLWSQDSTQVCFTL